MGFFLTLCFLFAAYLSPPLVFGPLAQYHMMIVLAVLTTLATIPNLPKSRVQDFPQSVALIGLTFAVTMSFVFTYIGGMPNGLTDFIPSALSFFFVFVNFRKKWQMQVLIAMLFLIATFIIAHGYMSTVQAENGMMPDMAGIEDGSTGDPYRWIFVQKVAEGVMIYRIRGLDFLHDPNDFAQFTVALMPCMFFFWKKGNSVGNFVKVYVPAAILFTGMFLTHSRGGILALSVVLILALRKKIGILPAVIGGGFMLAAFLALGMSGGRDVSSGNDRMAAWSRGIELIISHPLFGVGYKRFAEYYEITAHNTVVVCAAELGLIGLVWWLLLMVPTIYGSILGTQVGLPAKTSEEDEPLPGGFDRGRGARPRRLEPEPAMAGPGQHWKGRAALRVRNADARAVAVEEPRAVAAAGPRFGSMETEELLGLDELRRLSNLMLLSFSGFLVAGWFLSRAYTIPLYVNVGMGCVIYRMLMDEDPAIKPLQLGKMLKWSMMSAVGLLVLVYVILHAHKLV